jgi:hypothetical protein
LKGRGARALRTLEYDRPTTPELRADDGVDRGAVDVLIEADDPVVERHPGLRR